MSQLYRGRIRKRDMLFFLLAAMLAFVILVLVAFPRVYPPGPGRSPLGQPCPPPPP